LRTATLSFILLLLILLVAVSQAQEPSLTVHVYDLEGNPRQGVELVLSNSTFRRTFTTLAQGRAEFRVLSPGTYNLSATLDGAVVAQETVEIPRQTSVNLTIQVRGVRILVTDIAGGPVQGLSVELRSTRGSVVRRGNTGADGAVRLNDLPISSLKDVGPYLLIARVGPVVVLNTTLEVTKDTSSYNSTAAVAWVRLEVVDIAGNPLNFTAVLTSSRYNYSARLDPQKPTLLPTEDAVGAYVMRIEKTYEGAPRPIELLRREVSIRGPQNISLILDVGDLYLKVQDDAGEPLRGLMVEVSSEKLGLISRAVTGATGALTLRSIPFSEGEPSSGVLEITVYKEGVVVARDSIIFLPGSGQHTLVVNRVEAVVKLVKRGGDPLANATVRLVDLATRRVMTQSSDLLGRTVFRLLPGLHEFSVSYMGVTVSSGRLNATQGDNVIAVENVDIPFKIQVVDWAGAPITGARLSATWRGSPVSLNSDAPASYSGVIPVPDWLTVDVYVGERLVERRTLYVSSEALYVLRVRGFAVSGALVDVEMVVTGVIGAALALVVAGTLLSRMRGGVVSLARPSARVEERG
jgi:protocatechuate 3,4-dioxygenase beta subunit